MSVLPEAGGLNPASRLVARRDGAVRFQRTVRLTVQFTDLLIGVLAFWVAYHLRYSAGIGGDVADENFVPFEAYLPLMAGVAVGFFLIGRMSRIYHGVLLRPLLDEVWTVMLSFSFTMMLLFGGIFLLRSLAYSRGLFLMAWVLALVLLAASRLLGRVVLAALRQRGVGIERVLVVGGGRLGQKVMHVLTTEPGLSYRLVGFLQGDTVRDMGRFKCLGTVDDLVETVHLHEIDEVIVAVPSEEHGQLARVTELCAHEGVSYKIVPDLFEMSLSLSPVDVAQLRGIPLIGPRLNTIGGGNLLIKRAMDVVVASAILVGLSPLWALVCLAIRLDSPGPVFFVQKRVGKDHNEFPARKFRSMYMDAEARLAELSQHNEAEGPIFKMRNDPRVTRVGKWLRRTSLDEFPQLLNVLSGEMSLVGPRPPIPAEVAQYEEWHMQRLSAAPGMTGLWQVSGRSELPFDEMVLLDIYYIENWSLGLDLQIMLRTIPAVLSGHGAY